VKKKVVENFLKNPIPTVPHTKATDKVGGKNFYDIFTTGN
jgi:hypothetical protein